MTVYLWFSDPPGSGIGRYTSTLLDAVEEAAPLHYILSRGKYMEFYRREERIYGPFSRIMPPMLSVVLDRKIQPRISHSVLSQRDDISVIHYLSQHEAPFRASAGNQIATVHDLTTLKGKPANFTDAIYRRMVASNIKRIFDLENIITVSDVVRMEIDEAGYTGRIHVIHHCASRVFQRKEGKMAIRKRLSLPRDDVILISVSTGSQRKNLEMIRQVMKKLGDRYMLIRIGPGLGLSNERDFFNISDDLLNDLYCASDMLIFPSTSEGFGYPLVEAMATGLPIIALDIPIIREIAGDAAILLDGFDADALVDAVKANSENLQRLSEISLARGKSFSFDRFAEQYRDLYSKISSRSLS
ncbi:MAG: glycosyltransferase family 4 protein [Candidatus Thermoplasmatota archaeon]|nr:glycosyltransferase family 4 protein [Candidatus Thermoplasmatota archaeon]